MVMHKRGQITVFVILGILIVAVLGLIFYLYNLRTVPEVEKISGFDFSRTEVLKNYIEGCIEKAGNEALNLVGKQGGEINPGFYKPYFDSKVSYLCYTNSYSACYNKKPFLHQYIEKELTQYVNQKISVCLSSLDKELKNRGYSFEKGTFILSTKINPYSVIISLNYPLTITKGTSKISINNFTKLFNIPLGRLIEVAEDIVNNEINSPLGFFSYQTYIILQNGEIQIERDIIEKTEIYIVTMRNKNYKFQFAIQNYPKPFP